MTRAGCHPGPLAAVAVNLSGTRLDRRGSSRPHGGQHRLDRRQAIALPGHLMPIHQDRELALRTVYDVHADFRLPLQRIRHTGGVLSDAGSDRALLDYYLLHDRLSFCLASSRREARRTE